MPGWAASQSAWDSLRTSFWFVPTLMGAGGAALTGLSLLLEAATTDRPEAVPWFVYVSAADNARDLTSTLLASMMTMASLVFSITMVVLTLAAGQFGPRLIRNFMGARPTQLVLGTFVMTIVHCLLSLSAIGWRESGEAQPYFTVTVAILLSLVSVGLLVLHLHVLARSIMSETVIARVAQELSDTLDTMGPIEPEQSDPDAALPDDFYERAAFFGPNATGYVRTIDFDRLVAAGHEADALIGLTFRPGDFVIESGGVIGIYPEERATQEMAEAARQAIVIGAHRTPVQDPDFSIRHLVEIAVRALSPGINDPYTAISVIDQLSGSLARLFARDLPDVVRRDDDGAVRVLCPRPTYASLVSAAFDQIRQNGAAKPAVIIHLIQAVERLAPHVRNKEQKQALADQLETILETARRGIPETGDRAAVEARAETAREAVATGRLRHG
jgi:uncharacterized membrane protein